MPDVLPLAEALEPPEEPEWLDELTLGEPEPLEAELESLADWLAELWPEVDCEPPDEGEVLPLAEPPPE